MLTSLGDVHLNYYDAITDYVVVNGLKEYTLDGFDAQIAFPLPYLPTSKIYAEVFSWNGINSSRDLEGETYSVKNNLPNLRLFNRKRRNGLKICLGPDNFSYMCFLVACKLK